MKVIKCVELLIQCLLAINKARLHLGQAFTFTMTTMTSRRLCREVLATSSLHSAAILVG